MKPFFDPDATRVAVFQAATTVLQRDEDTPELADTQPYVEVAPTPDSGVRAAASDAQAPHDATVLWSQRSQRPWMHLWQVLARAKERRWSRAVLLLLLLLIVGGLALARGVDAPHRDDADAILQPSTSPRDSEGQGAGVAEDSPEHRPVAAPIAGSECEAVDALLLGEFQEALGRYNGLLRAQPDAEVFGVAQRILEREVQRLHLAERP
ncbi:MAG: hypothetical protein M0R76_07490 [Proteobacteria bacterium]|nr:hypothetical protein [Pseudomonadota bacterium]